MTLFSDPTHTSLEADLKEMLAQSCATETFKEAASAYLAGEDSELIKCSPRAPRVKVIRVLTKLLHDFANEPITDVEIQGVSTCSAFAGILTFRPSNTKIEFNWDCSWKAEQMDLQTWYGAPDQTKAAQLFGYQCFEKFQTLD